MEKIPRLRLTKSEGAVLAYGRVTGHGGTPGRQLSVAGHLFHALDGLQFPDELLQPSRVVQHDRQVAGE